MDWQPIETAPKENGSRFLVAYVCATGDYRIVVAERDNQRITSNIGVLDADDDMWMPMPDPPVQP